jgi:hypothetical protein
MRSCVDGRPGRFAVMVASVSSLSASFAARQLSRRVCECGRVGGVCRIECGQRTAERGVHVGEDRLVEIDASESLIPSGVPAREKPTSDAISTAESNVPPPKS